jgi:hypothetical protein
MPLTFDTLADSLYDISRKTGDVHGYVTVYNLVLIVAEVLDGTFVYFDDMTARIGYDYSIVHSRQKLTEKRFSIFWYK